MKHHIRHLKRHRNILYGLVAILVVSQAFMFVTTSSQIAQVHASQLAMRKAFNENLGEMQQENQYKITEITREVSKQRNEFQSQINRQEQDFQKEMVLLRASQSDFSEVIEESLKGVVSISTDTSSGTGFFVHASGYIITNSHVVQNARFIKVVTYNDEEHDAVLVGEDESADLAILKTEGIFNPLELAEESETQIGDNVIAIGNPLGLSFTVTEGIVSALGREGLNGANSYVQTDVTLNPGNSGGPLINKLGHVVGVNNFKIGNADGLGFALESKEVDAFIKRTVTFA